MGINEAMKLPPHKRPCQQLQSTISIIYSMTNTHSDLLFQTSYSHDLSIKENHKIH